jgi:HEAT repeat protein
MVRVAPLAVLLALLLATPLAAARDGDGPRPASEVLRDLKGSDPVARLNAVEEARELQDASITRQLVKLIKDKDPELRTVCIDALRGRETPAGKKSAAQALAARLTALTGKAVHVEEYLLVIAVLHDLAEPVAIEPLLDMEVEEERETARARMMAVGNTPSREAVEALIAFASKGRHRGRNNQRKFAIDALRYATGENQGNDPDRWRIWWNDVKREWDPQRAADKREAKREAERLKKAKKEEQRRKAEERRRKKREKKEAEGGAGD